MRRVYAGRTRKKKFSGLDENKTINGTCRTRIQQGLWLGVPGHVVRHRKGLWPNECQISRVDTNRAHRSALRRIAHNKG